ncbi:MAG: DUF4198 domain-containing protein [Leptonema sp. (in: bacteria)]
MKKYYYKFFLLIGCFFISGFPILFCHDLWIEKKNHQFILQYGHILSHSNSDFNPKFLEYKKENVREIQCLKNYQIQKITISKVPIYLPECDIFFVEFTTGFWTQTLEGLKNEPPEKIPLKVLDAWESIEYLKQIYNWEENYHQLQGNPLEITPLENPFLKKVGDKIKVQVLYQKEPISNIPIAYGEDIRGVTDREGKFSIRLQKKGYQIIRTTLTKEAMGPRIKKIITSTLIFSL